MFVDEIPAELMEDLSETTGAAGGWPAYGGYDGIPSGGGRPVPDRAVRERMRAAGAGRAARRVWGPTT